MIYLNGWVEFIKEDIVRSKSIISKKMEAYEKIKVMLQKNQGYIGQFTDWIFSSNISVEDLKKTYEDLLYLKSKNKNININGLKYEECVDKIQILKEEIDISVFINQLPKTQKDFIKSYREYSDKEFKVLIRKVLEKPNLDPLISKISRYKTENDLISALKTFAKDINNTKEGLINLLSNCKKSKILYEVGDIVIVWVGTQDDIKILGSDTSWCIVNSISLWTSYTSDGKKQLILYDFEEDAFSPNLKLGFTINETYISAAHNILDHSKKDLVREKLVEIGVKVSDIYSKISSINSAEIGDISGLRSNMGISRFLEFGLSCKREDIPKVLEKIPKRGEWKSVYIKLLKRYFTDELITIGEIKRKISGIKLDDGKLRNYFLDEKYPCLYTKNQNIISKGLDIWSDKLIISSIKSGLIEEYNLPLGVYKFSFSINDENSDKLFKRIKKIVNENDLLQEEDRRFWEFVIILYSHYEEKLPSKYKQKYELLSSFTKSKYSTILKMDFELDSLSSINPDVVKNIIKKDYENPFHIRKEMFTSGFMDSLLEHLDGYNLVFKVGKNELLRINGLDKQKHNDKVKSLLNMCDRIFNSKQKEIVEGNIKLIKYTVR